MAQRGFILIIIVGMLGILSFLAINLVRKSQTSVSLQQRGLHKTKAKLYARSGYEIGVETIAQSLQSDFVTPLRVKLAPLQKTMDDGWAFVELSNNSGMIDVNDGVSAGQLELNSSYNSKAIDPRPETSPGSGTYVADISGLINLRIRRLLNSYGDAHKFVADLGEWPVWKNAEFTGAAPYGQAFTHSATGVGLRHQSLPGRDVVGSALINSADIAARSTGLGDRIVSSRPQSGYSDIDEIKLLLNKWAQDISLPVDYWKDQGFNEFSDLTTADLTTRGNVDENFYRIAREFGPDNDGDGFIDYNNDQTDPLVPTESVVTSPPNMANLWIKHPTSVININESSSLVRAAVFYSPTNISLSCEGVMLSRDSGGTTNADPFHFDVPTLGVGGVVFDASALVENGDLGSRQTGKLMSLRDALVLSQAYENYAALIPNATWPDSFAEFKRFLQAVTVDSSPIGIADNESATAMSGLQRHTRLFTNTSGGVLTIGAAQPISFHEAMLAEILPNILSPFRRVPGWLHAPIALMSPLGQQGNRGADPSRVLRSAEDFVLRCPLPKINFVSGGQYKIVSKGEVADSLLLSRARVSVDIQLFESRSIRSQSEFVAATDPSTDSQILIGPDAHDPGNSSTVEPNEYLGVVGLKDRVEDSSALGATWTHSCRMTFDANDPWRVDTAPGSSPIQPQSSSLDTFLLPQQAALQNSGLEGNDVSMFSAGNQGSDLSVFGGISLGSRGHGHNHTERFSDSLYWRPYETGGFLASGQTPGDVINKGMISMWVRIPSGYYKERSIPLFQMTLWENVMVHDYDTYLWASPWGAVYNSPVTTPAVLRNELRPITFTLSYEIEEPKVLPPPSWWWFSEIKSPGNYFRFSHSKGRQLVPGFVGSGNGFMTSLPWSDDITLPLLPYPPANGPYPDNILGAMYPTRPPGGISTPWFSISWNETPEPVGTNDARHWMYKKGRAVWVNGTNHVNFQEDARTAFGGGIRNVGDNGLCVPGTWQRVLVAWDLTQVPTNHENRMWINVPTSKYSWKNDQPRAWRSPHTVTRNPKMVMSLGEQPAYWSQNTPFSTFANLPAANEFIPMSRANTLIDNVDIRFGSTGPFTSQSLFESIDSNPSFSDFKTKRYDLTVVGEPTSGTASALTREWVLNPNLKIRDRLVSLGAQIYDVPDLNLPGQDFYNAPRVDIDFVRSSTTVTPIYATPARNFQSTAFKTYSTAPSTLDTIFKISWKSEDPLGQPVKDRLANIPWIKEVYWSYFPEEGVKILRWSAD